jgi:hypothetical protein
VEEGELPDSAVSGEVSDELPCGIPLPAPYTVESLQKHRARVWAQLPRHKSTGVRLHPLPSRPEAAGSARWASSGGGGEKREKGKCRMTKGLGFGASRLMNRTAG